MSDNLKIQLKTSIKNLLQTLELGEIVFLQIQPATDLLKEMILHEQTEPTLKNRLRRIIQNMIAEPLSGT